MLYFSEFIFWLVCDKHKNAYFKAKTCISFENKIMSVITLKNISLKSNMY